MDETKRTFTKALTWQTMGLFVMTLIGYATTGSWRAAGGLAVTTFGVSLVTYMLHERVWDRIAWGRRPLAPTPEAITPASRPPLDHRVTPQ